MAGFGSELLRPPVRHTRSKSDGMLIDSNESGLLNSVTDSSVTVQKVNFDHSGNQKARWNTNPFWNELASSNPFLDDIMQRDYLNANVSMFNEEPLENFSDDNLDAISTSSDETNFSKSLNCKRKSTRRSVRRKSASDILDVIDGSEPQKENSQKLSSHYSNADFERLRNDREAYKTAWLSQRNLTRSCLDLGLMGPGWAQSQATENQIICKIDHSGGSVQLPDSDISIHIPEGHVPPGDVQEIGMKAILDPPNGLNNDLLTTVSPLLELSLGNVNIKEYILLEMKISGKVKTDPLSQVMTKFVCLVSHRKEGPFQNVSHCYLDKDKLQIKLQDLKPHLYVIAAAKATILQPPASSVWDYMDRRITVGIYGPNHIHPSFKAVCVLFCHNEIPLKFSFSNCKNGGKNLPPLLMQLWGKEHFSLDELKDLYIVTTTVDSNYEVKAVDKIKEVKKGNLKTGRVLHLPFTLTKTGNGEMIPFKLEVHVKDSSELLLSSFQVPSPVSLPPRTEKLCPKRPETNMGALQAEPIFEETGSELLKFQDRPVSVQWYGVTLKSILRQPKVQYLLEYVRGDTVAILSREPVKLMGQSKAKEWYIGFHRGKMGLVHCKNVKLITKERVIDFTDVRVTTQVLLDNMTLPFKKLTYMYSAIETLVTEHVTSWRGFAEALGYSSLSLNTVARRHTETEAEKVACVLEKLKEDCHVEKSPKKFQQELIAGLLKMDAHGLVARLTQNTVILSTAVELGVRWRELADRLGKLSNAQIAAYEAPHQGKGGEVSSQSMWKPAYDFLYTWSVKYGERYGDLIQDLHLALDRMKNPVTRHCRQITGALITINCMEVLHDSAFPKT